MPGMPVISRHLTAEKYMGLAPLDASDAIGVTHKGRTYKWTGKRGTDVTYDGLPCVKARARNADGDEIDVVQWLIPAVVQTCLVAPLDVQLIFPPTADDEGYFGAGYGWREFR